MSSPAPAFEPSLRGEMEAGSALTHVIQQRKGPVAGTETGDGLKASDPSDRFEREAEANAVRAMSGPSTTRSRGS